MPKIRVHEKALAHLTRGLYRSPGSALRELVSNAWDANATVVRIDTNAPNFFELSIEDNGDGFDRDLFEKVMNGGIGNSEKRQTHEDTPLKYGRPTIGRLGIGMLGIAQIALGFTITSRTANNKGFRATIKLTDLLKPKLDTNDPSVVIAPEQIDIGTYEFDDSFDPKTMDFGTNITTTALHPQFIQAFKDSVSQEGYREVPGKWKDALVVLSKVESLQQLGDYWILLWELAASAPLKYIDEHAVPRGMVKEEQKRLQSCKFRLIVDGVELLKPTYLKNQKPGYIIDPLNFSTRVYGKPVSLHGYIAVRNGVQVRPDELRGLMIRIKNIGIGYFDQTLLDFRVNQGPRSRWVTGEIYIDQGLEDALNVDRDSFNKFHPEFRAVQQYIHGVLKKVTFPRVYVKMDVRSDAKAKQKRQERSDLVSRVVSDSSTSPVRVRVIAPKGEEDINASVKESKGKIDLVIPSEDTLQTKKAYRQSAAAILGIFEIAMREKGLDSQRTKFKELLLKLFDEW